MKPSLILLLIVGFITNSFSQNIFKTACNGDLKRLDSLLSTAEINTKDEYGQNLLHWAVACKQNEIAKLLIENKIPINEENDNGRTPIYMALKYNNEILELLINLQKGNGWKSKSSGSLIEIAVLRNNSDGLKTLVSHGVNINSKNDRGNTGLEIAKRLNNMELYNLILHLGGDESLIKDVKPKGDYFGEKPPGLKPRLFASNFISTELEEFGSVFNSAGTEFFFAAHLNGKSEIKCSKIENGVWTQPKSILVHNRYGFNDPFLSPDEKRLYFISDRPADGIGKPKDIDIWYVERQVDSWSEPINAGQNINTSGEDYYISFTNNGTMFFSTDGHYKADSDERNHDIYYSKFKNNEFQKAIKLPDEINTSAYEADVFVAPDESYLIFCSARDGGLGKGDLYISFKANDGKWLESKNMGDVINSANYEYCPFVSHDGKYLFFTSNQDIYWVSMDVVELLKN